MLKLKTFVNFIFLLLLIPFLAGCATLSYVGEDSAAAKTTPIKTQEDFFFNVTEKNLPNLNVKAGISRSPVAEILVLYIKLENLSYETPYTFKVEDLRVYNPDAEVQFITTNNYLSIFQNQESQAMASMSSMGATFTTMSGLAANYNEYNQSIAQNSSETSNKSAFKRMEETGNNILAHTVKYSSVISPRKAQYYYFFFQDTDKFPITVKYKNLNYQFKV